MYILFKLLVSFRLNICVTSAFIHKERYFVKICNLMFSAGDYLSHSHHYASDILIPMQMSL